MFETFIHCLIYYLSPSYSPVIVTVEKTLIKKRITQEQLIGVVCGSAAVFFLILSIIAFVVRRIKRKVRYSDLWTIYENDENEPEIIQKKSDCLKIEQISENEYISEHLNSILMII